MEGILGLLFIVALFVVPIVICIGGGSLILRLLTGKSPTEYAYGKEVDRRTELMRQGRVDAQMNREALRRLLDED